MFWKMEIIVYLCFIIIATLSGGVIRHKRCRLVLNPPDCHELIECSPIAGIFYLSDIFQYGDPRKLLRQPWFLGWKEVSGGTMSYSCEDAYWSYYRPMFIPEINRVTSFFITKTIMIKRKVATKRTNTDQIQDQRHWFVNSNLKKNTFFAPEWGVT